MMDSLSMQLYAFAITMLAGASIGLAFDLYRVIRALLRPGTLATILMDLCFWLVLAPVVVVYLLLANWGELRFYVLIGIGLGLAFYYLIFSRTIIRMFIGLIHFISYILSYICQFIFWILAWPIKFAQDIILTIRAKRRGRSSMQFSSGWRFRFGGLRWQSPFYSLLRRR